MKKSQKITASLMASFAFTAMTYGADNAQEQPLTPRTSTTRIITQQVADETHPFTFELKGDHKALKVLPQEDPTLKSVIGLFPSTTKSSQALAFVQEVASGKVELTFAQGSTEDLELITGYAKNEEKRYFLIIDFYLPKIKIENATSTDTPILEKPEYKEQWERFEHFSQKAGKDIEKAAQNVATAFHNDVRPVIENVARNEIRPTVEQEARNTGKAVEKVGQNVRRLFGGKK